MKLLTSMTAVGLLLVSFANASAQTKPGLGKPSIRGTRSASTGFPISINQPVHNDQSNNPDQKPIIVVVYCNATVSTKDLEGLVGQNAPLSLQQMVASETGPDRISITFVVPYDWWYQINVNHPPNNTQGPPAGGVCLATGWWTY